MQPHLPPRPHLSIHADDVDLEIPGVLTLRATFLSEGLFDEGSDGDPAEEDLYEVEVSSAGEELVEPIVFPRLSPVRLPFDTLDDPLGGEMGRWVLALGWQLAASHPERWRSLCESARWWDAWAAEEILARLPSEWTPTPLIPTDEDL